MLHQLWPSTFFALRFSDLEQKTSPSKFYPYTVVDEHCSSSWDLAEACSSSDGDDSADNISNYLVSLANWLTFTLQQVRQLPL